MVTIGVLNAVVIYTVQCLVEAFSNLVKILQCQLAFIQLSVQKHIVYDTLHETLDSRRCGVLQRLRSSFDFVGQKYQTRLFCLGLGPWIPEMLQINSVIAL